MARKSRKINFVNVGSELLATQAEEVTVMNVSHAALYARLSFESDKNKYVIIKTEALKSDVLGLFDKTELVILK